MKTTMSCSNCYGGHFRPCQTCGDSGLVDIEYNLINLTPHKININTDKGELVILSTGCARVKVETTTVGSFGPVPLVKSVFGEVEGLPDPVEGTLYIVSMLVRTALAKRDDLASPASIIRNEDGIIIGCGALEIN